MAGKRLWLAWAALTGMALFALCGCWTRTIYVPAGKTVRLRQDIPGVKIWAKDAEGKLTPGVLDLREGWYIGPRDDPPPEVEGKK
jgi:hypothetical protein